eukprot:296792_1
MSGTDSIQIIKLNVGGTKFHTTKSTLHKFGFFRGLLTHGHNFHESEDENGYYFVDRDGKMFEYLLNYARCGYVSIPTKYTSIIDREAKFYQIELNLKKFMQKRKLPQLLLTGSGTRRNRCRVNNQLLDEVYKSYGLDENTKSKYKSPAQFAVYLTEHFGYEIALRSSHMVSEVHYSHTAVVCEDFIVLKPNIPEHIVLIKDNNFND